MTGVVGHQGSRDAEVVVGVDTHQDEHVAVAVDRQGVLVLIAWGSFTRLRPPMGMRSSNGGPGAWERFVPSGSRAPVPTAPE